MKFKQVIVGLLLLAGALFGAAKGYIHYRVSDELDKVIPLLSPFAEIRYEGIGSSYEGRIAIEKVRIYPVGSNDEIRVESLQIAGNGLPFLYRLMTGGFQERPPERFRLSIDGLSIPLDGDLSANYSRMLERAKQASGIQDPDGCGLLTGLSPTMMGALGFYAMTVDILLDVDFNQSAGEAELRMGVDLRGIESSQVAMRLTNVPRPGVMVTGAQRPRLATMSMRYRVDPDFVARAQQYCAASRGMTVDAFVASMLDWDRDQLARQLGFRPGPGLVAAIRRFIKKPDEVRLSIAPSAALEPGRLAFYKPEEIPGILHLALSVNGEPVSDLSFSVPEPPAGRSQPAGGGLAAQLSNAKTVLSPRSKRGGTLQKPRPVPQYLPTPVAQLPRYLDKKVRVYTNQENALRKGVLLSVAQDQIVIRQRLYGGEMTVEVPLGQISRVEVYRLP